MPLTREFKQSSFCPPLAPWCVEIRRFGSVVEVRNSRNVGVGHSLQFTQEEWEAFLKGVKAGEFDI